MSSSRCTVAIENVLPINSALLNWNLTWFLVILLPQHLASPCRSRISRWWPGAASSWWPPSARAPPASGTPAARPRWGTESPQSPGIFWNYENQEPNSLLLFTWVARLWSQIYILAKGSESPELSRPRKVRKIKKNLLVLAICASLLKIIHRSNLQHNDES